MPFDPFNADGTWNWEAARNADEGEVNTAWERYRQQAKAEWRQNFSQGFWETGGQRSWSGGSRHDQLQRKVLQQFLALKPDLFLHALDEREMKERRIAENEQRAKTGQLSLIHVPTVAERLKARLLKEVARGICSNHEAAMLMEAVYRPTEVITPLSDIIAKQLLNPLSNFTSYESV